MVEGKIFIILKYNSYENTWKVVKKNCNLQDGNCNLQDGKAESESSFN